MARVILIVLGFLLLIGTAMAADEPLPPVLPGDEGASPEAAQADIFEFPELPAENEASADTPKTATFATPARTKTKKIAALPKEAKSAITTRVEEAVVQSLTHKGAGESILVTGMRFSRELSAFLPKEDETLNVQDISFDAKSGKFSGKIASPGQADLLFRGQYYAMREIPVLTRRMKRGDVIGEADIGMRPVPEKRLRPDGYMLAKEQLIGQTLRRALAPSHPVRRADISLPVAVEAGQEVNMLFRSGAMQLSDRGVVLDKGSVGDVIRVKNARSNQIVRARIETPEQVLVNYLDQPVPASGIAQSGGPNDRSL